MMLFLDGWTDLYDAAVRAYHSGDALRAASIRDALLSRVEVPSDFRDHLRRQQVLGARPLADLVPGTAVTPVTLDVPANWTTFNPSIAAADDGYLMIVRSSNYIIERGRYLFRDGGPTIRTRNYLVSLSADLVVRRVDEIEDGTDQSRISEFPVSGFEDCRLFRHDGSWFATATLRDRNGAGVCQIGLVRLEGRAFVDLRLLSDAGSGRHEKNWMPLPGADGLDFVYSSFPTVVVRYDEAVGMREVERHTAPPVAEGFRGGAQVVAVDDGYLGVVHESMDVEDEGRVYSHRFVFFDRDVVLSMVSLPFTFLGRGVEFCAGLARRGTTLVASFGQDDARAFLASMQIEDVLGALHPVAGETGRLFASSGVGAELGGVTSFDAVRPLVVSTTLTGNNADLIGDAIRSVVDWVDLCLVIDTGLTDETLAVAREAAGAKYVERRFPWSDDFSLARNFALHAARDLGVSWAVTLDTDERFDLRGVAIRDVLASVPMDVLRVQHDSGTYEKERFFRLPSEARFVGPTHEYVEVPFHRVGSLEGVRFSEVGKSAEQLTHKFERDVALLSRHVDRHPDDPRWLYYLGDALHGLGRSSEAIDAFVRCSELPGWDEQAAWACYRAAECWLVLGKTEEAIERCAVGLARHPGIAELSWLASYACWHSDRLSHAVSWAHLSIAMGLFRGRGREVVRGGFRNPSALYEGPYDVLRFALRRLGDEAGADEAQRLFDAAVSLRLEHLSEGR